MLIINDPFNLLTIFWLTSFLGQSVFNEHIRSWRVISVALLTSIRVLVFL